ncbi:MAG: DsbA family protein [Myxococcota bacterium]
MTILARRLALSLSLLGIAACSPPPDGPKPILESTTAASVTTGKDDPAVVAADATTTPAQGAREPLVVVTVFTDFQCPFCPRVEPYLENIRLQYPDDVQIQYRHFPLMNAHPLAETAGHVTAAAHRQGGFKCMAQALYRTQKAWSGKDEAAFREFVLGLAPSCRLDAARLEADMADPLVIDRVSADVELGRDVGVRGTPWVMVDGMKAELSPKAEAKPSTLLSALIRRELREAQAQLEAGTPRAEIPAKRLFGNLGDQSLVDRLLDR